MTIRVVLADDQDLVRGSFALLVNSVPDMAVGCPTSMASTPPREVLRLNATGLTDLEIAGHLTVSPPARAVG
jgi:DNA-binding NarL/FixJ family response regulator